MTSRCSLSLSVLPIQNMAMLPGDNVVCETAEKGKTFLRKEQETTECKKDFSLRSK